MPEDEENGVVQANGTENVEEQVTPETLERRERARKLRMLFSPPEMLDDDGKINQTYFRPTRQLFNPLSIQSLKWSEWQDSALLAGITQHGLHDWSSIIVEYLPNWDAQALAERAAVLLIGEDATIEDLQKLHDKTWRPKSYDYWKSLDSVLAHVTADELAEYEQKRKAAAAKNKDIDVSEPKKVTKKKKVTRKKGTPKKRTTRKKKSDDEGIDEDVSAEGESSATSGNEVEMDDGEVVYIPPESRSLRTRKAAANYVEEEEEEPQEEEDDVDSDNDFTD